LAGRRPYPVEKVIEGEHPAQASRFGREDESIIRFELSLPLKYGGSQVKEAESA
jgi:hypothetical protein